MKPRLWYEKGFWFCYCLNGNHLPVVGYGLSFDDAYQMWVFNAYPGIYKTDNFYVWWYDTFGTNWKALYSEETREVAKLAWEASK